MQRHLATFLCRVAVETPRAVIHNSEQLSSRIKKPPATIRQWLLTRSFVWFSNSFFFVCSFSAALCSRQLKLKQQRGLRKWRSPGSLRNSLTRSTTSIGRHFADISPTMPPSFTQHSSPTELKGGKNSKRHGVRCSIRFERTQAKRSHPTCSFNRLTSVCRCLAKLQLSPSTWTAEVHRLEGAR
jgi:hypothetical protein